jgi:very-short-patch-repair endonuclease
MAVTTSDISMEGVGEGDVMSDKLKGIRVDSETKMGSVLDVAVVVTGCSRDNARNVINRLPNELTKKLPRVRINGKGRLTPVASPETFKEVVKHLIANVRMSATQKQQLTNDWGMEGMCIVKSHIEPDLMETLIKAFANYFPQTQHTVGPYRVDLFLQASRVVIECDELGHSNYDAAAEMQRTLYITNALHCKWVRFNPHAPHFNIGDVICQTIKLL